MSRTELYLNHDINIPLNKQLNITSSEFVSQNKINEITALVDSLDFTPISFKL